MEKRETNWKLEKPPTSRKGAAAYLSTSTTATGWQLFFEGRQSNRGHAKKKD